VKKKVLLKGPLLTRSGYGEHARFVLRALRSQENIFDIFIQPLQWGQTSWLNESSEERQWIDYTIEKTIAHLQQGSGFDMSAQVTIPNEWEKIAPVNIGITAGIETTKVSAPWIQKGNEMDKIIVVSEHSKNVYENTVYVATHNETNEQAEIRLTTPIDVVNYPVKTYDALPDLDIDLKNDFNFLCVAQAGPRKNLFNTIKWFTEEFHDDEVGLVLKTNIAKNCVLDREKMLFDIKSFLSDQKYKDRKCNLYLLHGDMTDEEMHSLYKHSKISSLVLFSHGEGFGLPLFEAAYSGLPVVTVGWSGHLDFLVDKSGRERFYPVRYDINQIPEEAFWEGVLIKESMWAYPQEKSAKQQMRLCYEDLNKNSDVQDASAQYAKVLHKQFSEEEMYKKMTDSIYTPSEEEIHWLKALSEIEIL
jgi:glycosyltransferase involved in cell wall biosynthesis